MYRAFYSLSQDPFTKDIRPQDHFPSKRFKQALARIKYLVETRGMGVILGEPAAARLMPCGPAFSRSSASLLSKNGPSSGAVFIARARVRYIARSLSWVNSEPGLGMGTDAGKLARTAPSPSTSLMRERERSFSVNVPNASSLKPETAFTHSSLAPEPAMRQRARSFCSSRDSPARRSNVAASLSSGQSCPSAPL